MWYHSRLRRHVCALLGVVVLGMAIGPVAGTALVNTAQAQDGAGDAAEAPAPQTSALAFYYRALGPIYTVVFLALSFVFVALIVMNVMSIRRQSVVPPDLVANFEALLNEKRFKTPMSWPRPTKASWDTCWPPAWPSCKKAIRRRSRPCRRWAKTKTCGSNSGSATLP